MTKADSLRRIMLAKFLCFPSNTTYDEAIAAAAAFTQENESPTPNNTKGNEHNELPTHTRPTPR